jgi:Flp pilus assembly protein TadG
MRHDEDGAIAVMVAILLVVLVGTTAFVVDIGDVMWERRMLQNSADAAALAVAIDCAQGECGTQAEYEAVAAAYADDNIWRGSELVSVTGKDGAPVVTVDDGEVTVAVATDGTEENPGRLRQWFSGVLGQEAGLSSQASATAVWGAVDVADAEIPLTVSLCDIKESFPDWDEGGAFPSLETVEESVAAGDLGKTILFHKSNHPHDDCSAEAGHDANDDGKLPAGWGWLAPEEKKGSCTIERISADEDDHFWAYKDPGNDPLIECLDAALNKPVVVPIFVDFQKSKPPAIKGDRYLLFAPAAFYLTGYKFPSKTVGDPGCSTSDTCIRGHWVTKLDPGKNPTGEISLGVNTVRMKN